jgi:hypothetical protein
LTLVFVKNKALSLNFRFKVHRKPQARETRRRADISLKHDFSSPCLFSGSVKYFSCTHRTVRNILKGTVKTSCRVRVGFNKRQLSKPAAPKGYLEIQLHSSDPERTGRTNPNTQSPAFLERREAFL